MQDFQLSPERRDALIREIQKHYSIEFDETLSDFRTEALINFMLKAIAPTVYNQAVQDVRAHLQTRLDDLDGEVYLQPSEDQ